ncbi:MAG: carbamoyltransferase HypF, partial [Bacteroidetes bacterium]|nr:carbamoyltransferase HypF [Bacteroidota bacterium]
KKGFILQENKIAIRIHVRGLVQGVGFRPFIYRLAHHFGLKGWVENRNDGVVVLTEGDFNAIESFIAAIRKEAPPASQISHISKKNTDWQGFTEFSIVKSKDSSDQVTDISPDIAVCNECMGDLKLQPNRLNYPFINCTNCGPRFSIISDLPYDRVKTTMAPFIICETCRREYEDVADRRFHAQPVACEVCGPKYQLISGDKSMDSFEEILKVTCNLLETGKIIAIKGIGGFQIACDAQNEETVNRLRAKKIREGKPFAVMFRNIDSLEDFVYLGREDKKSLLSWRRPIVITFAKKMLASGVSVGFNTIGAMLPYMPFHHLLFEKLKLPAIVLTSGNISDEPIVIENNEAIRKLTRIADAVLVYNRDIYNRTDDSVVFTVNERERVIRRSRGYSPEPVNLNFSADGIFAAGAELVNCFAIGKGNQAILSQHIGDLKNLETLEFYTESYERFKKLFRMNPRLVVHDKHPDYLSTKFAKDLNLPTLEVQHHHAHVASCMAEFSLDERVIGVSLDGTGYGIDGNIWGGEFFTCDLSEFERVTHFEYIPLPGGDSVTKEPWRTAVSYLYKIFGKNFLNLNIPFVQSLDQKKTELLLQAIDRKINCPLSSSAGRLFDAIAAITNICTVTNFHAEAPMRLENSASGTTKTGYPFAYGESVSFQPAIREIVQDLIEGVPVPLISAKFHNTINNVIFAVVSQIRKNTGLNKIVLSGGTFQNRYILSRIEVILQKEGFEIYTQSRIPGNGGGIALGQLAIASKIRELGGIDFND